LKKTARKEGRDQPSKPLVTQNTKLPAVDLKREKAGEDMIAAGKRWVKERPGKKEDSSR